MAQGVEGKATAVITAFVVLVIGGAITALATNATFSAQFGDGAPLLGVIGIVIVAGAVIFLLRELLTSRG